MEWNPKLLKLMCKEKWRTEFAQVSRGQVTYSMVYEVSVKSSYFYFKCCEINWRVLNNSDIISSILLKDVSGCSAGNGLWEKEARGGQEAGSGARWEMMMA